jgi:plasmid stability protein
MSYNRHNVQLDGRFDGTFSENDCRTHILRPTPRNRSPELNRFNYMRPMKQAVYSSRTADKFVVRLPDGMRERIAEVARTHHRSMNSEIIARLEQSLIQEGALGEELSMRLDSPELSLHERELLQRFRQLAHRQQNALIALIAHDVELTADADAS